jgi:hypothetical protein
LNARALLRLRKFYYIIAHVNMMHVNAPSDVEDMQRNIFFKSIFSMQTNQ